MIFLQLLRSRVSKKNRHYEKLFMKNIKKIIIIFVTFITAIVSLAFLLFWYFSLPVETMNMNKNPTEISDQNTTLQFTIPRGRAIRSIGKDLQNQGLIRSSWIFELTVLRLDIKQKIQAGTFELSPSMSVSQIAQALTQGTTDQWVTIKEGWRATEIGAHLEDELINFSTSEDDFNTECLAYEGFLFPETYLVPKHFTTAQMCRLMRTQYGEIFSFDLRNTVAQNTGLSDEEAVILASIIEREARDPEQMRHVAGILLNRLEIGMALQVDATLQYAKGFDQNRKTWWAPPLANDKQINSAYNTYTNPGLPPGPISNPGENALKAVAYPIESNDLFYLHSNDGNMYYAETYEGHLANIERYL